MQRVEKPWGYELIWAKTDRYVGKLLVIRKGHRLSFQYHRKKEETIYLSSGRMEFDYQEEGGVRQKKVLNPGDSFHIPAGLRHRMTALEDCQVFEASTPELADVVRLEDDYDRTGR